MQIKASIWRENLRGNLCADVICSVKRTVFRERFRGLGLFWTEVRTWVSATFGYNDPIIIHDTYITFIIYDITWILSSRAVQWTQPTHCVITKHTFLSFFDFICQLFYFAWSWHWLNRNHPQLKNTGTFTWPIFALALFNHNNGKIRLKVTFWYRTCFCPALRLVAIS